LGRGDSPERAERIVGALDGVMSATVENNHLHVVADRGANRLPAMLTALLNAGAMAESVRVVEPNLEDVFLRMTGRALRD
jgi:ABC-2 type transport system ATP-binding protein